MNVLGISALYHDSAAALCRDGEILAAAQEERFTRVKHDPSFPVNAIDYCLRAGGLTPYQIDAIAYYDNPLLTLDRWIHNVLAVGKDGENAIQRSLTPLFRDRLWVHGLALNHLKCLGRKNLFLTVKHHISHAASAFFPSPFQHAAILTVDGVGEWATTTLGVGRDNSVELLKEIDFPHSLGLLYSAFTAYCGFKVNSGEYKLMGLAPYGTPRYVDRIYDNLIDVKPDGSYRLNMRYFDYLRGVTMTNPEFEKLFGGAPRVGESSITQREMDLAASIQKVTEDAVLLLAKEAKRLTGGRNLVMAGGVALNCVANGRLLREGVFDRIWIQPAAGDAGGALGAALYAAHSYFGAPRTVDGKRDGQKGTLLGPAFDSADILRRMTPYKAVHRECSTTDELCAELARLLAAGKVAGFFQGRMEFGPRSLGARSILADPRDPATQSRLNLKIKYRESFRPFAPSVLREKASEYFELDAESPYMLLCAPVRKERRREFDLTAAMTEGRGDMLPVVNTPRSDIPAVTHVDFSARVQTVSEEDNPLYYALLKEFERRTGCAVLVNTSFNVRGEPIVCTPEDAYRCFMRTDMDVLAMENILYLKEEQPALAEHGDWRKEYELD